MFKCYETELAGRKLTIETGKIAELANGSVMVRYGDTVVMVNVTASKEPREGIDFFPLSVDYEEKLYAVGKIPGSFTKREGKPADKAILTSRAIDRPIRPLFPKDFRNDVCVVATVLSVEQDNSPEVCAMIGTAAALAISDIPFGGPTAAVNVGYVDDKIVINPTAEQREHSRLRLTVAGTQEKITMIEAGADEIPNDTMLDCIKAGHEEIKKLCKFIEGIKEEVGKVLKLIVEVYQKDFGFPSSSFKYRLSLRDKNNKEKYIDNDEMWETAESQLRAILKELNIDFYEAEGEAAFYGPKIDIQIKTALNHDVTIPTCQLDFALPERFDLTYVGEDNKEHRPVVIHRAILGSSDRFISFLIEETKGAFPLWLSPIQVKILPITDAQIDYCTELKAKLRAKRIRVELDDSNEKIGYKIRKAQLEKVPYMLIIGNKEMENEEVGVRSHKDGDIGAMKLNEFVDKIKYEVDNKINDK